MSTCCLMGMPHGCPWAPQAPICLKGCPAYLCITQPAWYESLGNKLSNWRLDAWTPVSACVSKTLAPLLSSGKNWGPPASDLQLQTASELEGMWGTLFHQFSVGSWGLMWEETYSRGHCMEVGWPKSELRKSSTCSSSRKETSSIFWLSTVSLARRE